MNTTTLTTFLLYFFSKAVRGSLPRAPLQPTRRPDIEVAPRPLDTFTRALLCFVSSHAVRESIDKCPATYSDIGPRMSVETLPQQVWLGSRCSKQIHISGLQPTVRPARSFSSHTITHQLFIFSAYRNCMALAGSSPVTRPGQPRKSMLSLRAIFSITALFLRVLFLHWIFIFFSPV